MKVLTVFAGFYLVLLALRAFRTQPSRTLLWLTLGMAVLTIGAISEIAYYQGFSADLEEAHLFEAVVTLVGLGFLVYSLHG